MVINSGLVDPRADAAFGNPANVILLNAGSGSSSGLVATVNLTLPSRRSIQLTTAGGNGVFREYNGFTFEINGAVSGPGNLLQRRRHPDTRKRQHVFRHRQRGRRRVVLANPSAPLRQYV